MPETPVVNVSTVWTAAEAAAGCIGGLPMEISRVVDMTPNAIPRAPSTSCAVKPIATKTRKSPSAKWERSHIEAPASPPPICGRGAAACKRKTPKRECSAALLEFLPKAPYLARQERERGRFHAERAGGLSRIDQGARSRSSIPVGGFALSGSPRN